MSTGRSVGTADAKLQELDCLRGRPLDRPKRVVSTAASGDVAPRIGVSAIVVIPPLALRARACRDLSESPPRSWLFVLSHCRGRQVIPFDCETLEPGERLRLLEIGHRPLPYRAPADRAFDRRNDAERQGPSEDPVEPVGPAQQQDFDDRRPDPDGQRRCHEPAPEADPEAAVQQQRHEGTRHEACGAGEVDDSQQPEDDHEAEDALGSKPNQYIDSE